MIQISEKDRVSKKRIGTWSVVVIAAIALGAATLGFLSSSVVTTEAPADKQAPSLRAASAEPDIPRHIPREEVEPAPVPPPSIELGEERSEQSAATAPAEP